MTKAIRLGLLVILVSPAIARATCFDRLIGMDLRKQTLSKQDQECLRATASDAPEEVRPLFSPWRVWRLVLSGQVRYVVFSGRNMMMIPDGSEAAFDLFDPRGEKIRGWSFQTGWRILLLDASIELSLALARDLLVVRVSPVINGNNVAKEYFSLDHDRL